MKMLTMHHRDEAMVRNAHVCQALRDLVAVIIRFSALNIGLNLSAIHIAEYYQETSARQTPGMVPFQIPYRRRRWLPRSGCYNIYSHLDLNGLYSNKCGRSLLMDM